ncbi:hypothetical protein CIPAW_13G032100 [Carya illinoinensis]|uniref:Uncharacterized protein n=1 Tax=Carya illinoinensis TaxID=32201 RepID=A0A8T1NLH1_CARIL|nr:hypothetical protein CIPAW_13G032100 [Carya illinoinensis]KAG6630622.1 hypothetical protein CIPAW_13G032100 [Carya illinoinensis]
METFSFAFYPFSEQPTQQGLHFIDQKETETWESIGERDLRVASLKREYKYWIVVIDTYKPKHPSTILFRYNLPMEAKSRTRRSGVVSDGDHQRPSHQVLG